MTTRAGGTRVLLVRTSALGDVVHALPVLVAIRRALPTARIAWAIDETFAPLLDAHELVDELVPLPLRRWREGGRGLRRELFATVARLRAFRAEIAIDLMGSHKGALLARLSGARRRIGARRADRREPASAVWINEGVELTGVHAVERGLALLSALGIPPAPIDFAPESLACGRDKIPDGEYIYLHPGAAWSNKRYPPTLWGEAAAQIRDRSTLEIRVGAAPGEADLADAVVAASRGTASRHEAPTLGDLSGAIRGARLVLGSDTGAIHLARALSKPVVALYGPTAPDRHGPWGAADSILFRRLPCSFCHQRMAEPKACLLGIAPESIAKRALELLS